MNFASAHSEYVRAFFLVRATSYFFIYLYKAKKVYHAQYQHIFDTLLACQGQLEMERSVTMSTRWINNYPFRIEILTGMHPTAMCGYETNRTLQLLYYGLKRKVLYSRYSIACCKLITFL